MMTSVTFPLPTRLAAVFELIGIAIRRRTYRRWLRSRPGCPKCPSCDSELLVEPGELLKAGHYRSAVFMGRLQLERRLVQLIGRCDVPDKVLGKRQYSMMSPVLRANGVITHAERNRINNVYSRSSKIVHGGLVTHQRATLIVSEMELLLMQLDDSNGYREPGCLGPVKSKQPTTASEIDTPQLADVAG